MIVIEKIEPTSLIAAEPDNKPYAVSKLAHAGMPAILKTKLSPSGSFADGVKFSASPTLIVEVLPEIVGAEFCTTVTGVLPPPPPQEPINKVTVITTKNLFITQRIAKTFIQISSVYT